MQRLSYSGVKHQKHRKTRETNIIQDPVHNSIQFPASITDNFVGSSNRNMHLQQFLLNHLSKKERAQNGRQSNNLPALESSMAMKHSSIQDNYDDHF